LQIKGPVRKGEALQLQYRCDANQVLQLAMRTGSDPDGTAFELEIENPLTNVVNPQELKARADEIEERLKTDKVLDKEQKTELARELADVFAKLGRHEAALEWYRRVNAALPAPSVIILNRMADCADALKDRERVQKLYQAATEVSDWSGSWFNWALKLETWGQFETALEKVERAIELEDDFGYVVLRARILSRLGRGTEAEKVLEEVLDSVSTVRILSDFTLSWILAAARMRAHKELMADVSAEMRKRQFAGKKVEIVEGDLPRSAAAGGGL
jgi:tetratricopeptide (TPR) repeat protein